MAEKNSNSPARQETAVPAKETPKKVSVTIPRERGKGDLYVAVNGRSMLIQRGVPVELPPAFAEVVRHALEQELAADRAREEAKNRR